MSRYTSKYTGPVIDAAVDVVNKGVAPAGYGLGENVGKSVASWDEAKNNGWYRGPAPKGIGSGTIWGRVDSMLNNYITQTLSTDAYPNCCVRRMCINGTWGEWEWENPPMVLGKEYRTTERYLGKPVYVKTLAVGALPTPGSVAGASLGGGQNNTDRTIDVIVRTHGYAVGTHNMKFAMPQKEYAIRGLVTEDNFGNLAIYNISESDVSGIYTASYVTAYYTKTTD